MITVKTCIGACAAAFLATTGITQAQIAVPASFAHPKTDLDTSAPGFLVRLHQANSASGELPNGLNRAEDQLAGFLIDPLTHQPYENNADFSAVTLNPDGTYSETVAIDYGGSGALTFPGIPGVDGSIANIAMEVTTYLDLDPGTYTMIVNSDDDFQVRVGPDARDKMTSIVLGEFNAAGGRGAGDTQFQFTISQAGAYSFRLIYEQGGGGYNCNWYVAPSTADDPHILVNADGGVKAYQKLKTTSGTYVDYLSPLPNQQGVSPAIVLKARIKDGPTTTVTPSSVKLYFDNTLAAGTVTHDANGTVVTFDPAGLLDVLSQHTVALVYTDSTSTVSSNSFKFTVANFGNIQLPAPIVYEDFETTDEASLPAGWTVQNFSSGDTGVTDLDDPNSDAYMGWVVITADRVAAIGAAGKWDGNLRLSHPDEFVNGAPISGIVSNKFAYAESDQRGGNQIQYLFSKDYDLTGKDHLYVGYYSMYEQNQDSIGSVEYSIDGGTTWLPIVYMIDQADIKYAADGTTIDGYATLSAEQTDTASLTDPDTGEEIGHMYGAFIGVKSNLWSNLGPFISGRVNDDGLESKRVELFPIPQADNQKTVRFRFAQAGTGSWYFGIDNLGVYSINIVQTPPTISLVTGNMAIRVGQPIALSVTATGTAPLTYEWSKNGNVISSATTSSYNIASATAGDSGKYTITVRNAKGAATKDIIVNVIGGSGDLANGLVVHLPFDDTYNDTSGKGNNATAAGTPDFQTGKIGKALHVKTTTDGTTENYASLGYPNDLKFADTTDFSISMWVNVTSQSDDHPFISNKNWASSNNKGWGIFTQSSGNLRDQVTGPTSGDKFSVNPPVNWKDNAWHNIVVTFKRGAQSVAYFDGVPVLTSPFTTAGTIDTDDVPLAVNIGQDGTGAYTDGGGSSLDALIDDVGIWRRVLTSDEAGTIFLRGQSGQDLGAGATELKIATFTISGGQLHITVTGGSATARLQTRPSFDAGTSWQDLGPITGSANINATSGMAFYRVVNP
jgi:hypothetical protein